MRKETKLSPVLQKLCAVWDELVFLEVQYSIDVFPTLTSCQLEKVLKVLNTTWCGFASSSLAVKFLFRSLIPQCFEFFPV